MHQLVRSMLKVTTAFSWLLRVPGETPWASSQCPETQRAMHTFIVTTDLLSEQIFKTHCCSQQVLVCLEHHRLGERLGETLCFQTMLYQEGQTEGGRAGSALTGATSSRCWRTTTERCRCWMSQTRRVWPVRGTRLLPVEILFKFSGWGKQGNVSKTGLNWDH